MESDGDGTRVFGLSVEEAVEAFADRDDPETRRATLEQVAEDGTVTRAGVDDAVAHVSKVVATPETRLEVAEDTLDEVRAEAEDAADVDAVGSRLDAFERRHDAVATNLASVQDDLGAVVERAEDPVDVYALARDIADLRAAANDVQAAADELSADAEAFGRWLDDPDRRCRAFDGDLEALESAVGKLDTDPAGAAEWLDATLRRRLFALLAADLRAELADLERLADGGDGPPAAFDERLDAIEGRLASAEDALDAAARPAWRERHGDRVADFEDALADRSPPVPWDEVWARYEDALPE